MFVPRAAASRIFQQTVRRYHNPNFKPPTMDDLPVPRGSWQAKYDANQRRYNGALLLGVAFAAISLVVGKTTGLLYLNYNPPKSLD